MSSSKASTLANGLLVLCAVVATGLIVRRELGTAPNVRAGTEANSVALPDSLWNQAIEDGWSLGANNAPVQLVEFTDFECPACREFGVRALEGAKLLTGPDFRLTVRHLPLPYHRLAESLAHASECAGDQGKFWSLHDLFFQKADSLGIKSVVSYAMDAGVSDSAAFSACQRAGTKRAIIERDVTLARSVGAPGTPTLLLNGSRESGLLDSVRLTSRIQELIAAARESAQTRQGSDFTSARSVSKP